MLTSDEQKLLKLNLRDFPLMAAASATIRNSCSSCRKQDPSVILRAAAVRLQGNKSFLDFLKANFKLPVSIGGITFRDK